MKKPRKRKSVVVETAVGRVVLSSSAVGRFDIAALTEAPARKRTRVTVMAAPEGEELLDLHGVTTDEVEPRLGAFIDRAIIDGRRRVLINHGKGSGRVKGEVWRLLKIHPAIAKYEFAPVHEGSYGVTAVVLK